MFSLNIKPWMAITVAAIFLAIILYICGAEHKSPVSKENRTASISDTINYKDKYNAEHKRCTELINENALSKREKDSLKERLSVSDKQLQKYIKTNITIPGNTVTSNFDTTTIPVKTGSDSTVVQHEAYVAQIKDNILDGIATVIPDLKIVTLNYKPIEINLNHAEIFKRRRWLGVGIFPRIGRKIWYIDAWCDNPLIKINGLESYQINK